MDDQASTIDETFGHPAEPSAAGPVAGVGSTPTLSSVSLPEAVATTEGKEPSMNQHESSEEAPAASLVGSLAAFSLSDVLSMLASTKQTGELQVVSDTADGKVWLADGELSNAQVGAAATIGQAVFELACVADGWFYFTVGVVSSSGQPTVPVIAVLNEVRPQVDEWRDIRRDVPLEAVVTLAPDPPGQDVQIRSDQWRVLTTVGTGGHSVRTVLDQIGGDQIVGLRTLRDLRDRRSHRTRPRRHGPARDRRWHLSSHPATRRELATAARCRPRPTGPTPGSTMWHCSAPPPPPSDGRCVRAMGVRTGLAEVAVMPPPIADDPWTPSADSSHATDDGVA